MADVQDVTSSMERTASSNKDGAVSPSGFVLKLFQMVNGAPDEIISWIPSGDAFLIQNLSRLEAEALPRYFRHSRFQSLVRQLNFYNFRKINRERTFWVYAHPLFHRDRPMDLHLLRRRAVSPTPSTAAAGGRARRGNSVKPDQEFDCARRTADSDTASAMGCNSRKSNLLESTFEHSVEADERDAEGLAGYVSFSAESMTLNNNTPGEGPASQATRKKRKSDVLDSTEKCQNSTTNMIHVSSCYESAEEAESVFTEVSCHERKSRHSVRTSTTRADKSNRKLKKRRKEISSECKSDDSSTDCLEPHGSECNDNVPVVEDVDRSEDVDNSKDVDSRKVVVLFPDESKKCPDDAVEVTSDEHGDEKVINCRELYLNDDEESKGELPAGPDKSKISRSERIEQSLMVSQVAQKLEEYARSAAYYSRPCSSLRGKGGTGQRARSGSTGVITPPTSTVRLSDTMRYNALTYDDEIGESHEEWKRQGDATPVEKKNAQSCNGKYNSLGLAAEVTDGDDTSIEEDEKGLSGGRSSLPTRNSHAIKHRSTFLETKDSFELKDQCADANGDFVKTVVSSDHLSSPPVNDTLMIAIIHRKLLSCLEQSGDEQVVAFSHLPPIPRQKESVAAAALAKFCMSTPPCDGSLGVKMQKLMNSCETLLVEFQRYCAALCPLYSPPADAFAISSCGVVAMNNTVHPRVVVPFSRMEGLECDAKDKEYERVFRAFAVNYMEDIVRRSSRRGRVGSSTNMGLEQAEKTALKICRDVWFKSATLTQ